MWVFVALFCVVLCALLVAVMLWSRDHPKTSPQVSDIIKTDCSAPLGTLLAPGLRWEARRTWRQALLPVHLHDWQPWAHAVLYKINRLLKKRGCLVQKIFWVSGQTRLNCFGTIAVAQPVWCELRYSPAHSRAEPAVCRVDEMVMVVNTKVRLTGSNFVVAVVKPHVFSQQALKKMSAKH